VDIEPVMTGRFHADDDATKVYSARNMHLLGDVNPNNQMLSGNFFNELILSSLRFKLHSRASSWLMEF
jgi:hypothetical protein